MSEAPERIWIEDEFGEGDDDQWTYGTWDVRNYRGYVVEYVRADIVQALTAERDGLLRCVTDNHVALCRAEKAEAERGGYRKALEGLMAHEPDYSDTLWQDARAALEGESHE